MTFALRFRGADGTVREVGHIVDIRTAQRDASLLRLAGIADVAIVREAAGAAFEEKRVRRVLLPGG